MKGVRIKDGDKYLSFDLLDILKELPEEFQDCRWCVSNVEATMKKGVLAPEPNRSFDWNWSEVLQFASSVFQTIDGRFSVWGTSSEPPILVIDAVDSCFWEVCSTNNEFISRLKSRFNEVEVLSSEEIRDIIG